MHDRQFPGAGFNPTPPPALGGGRFDTPAGAPAYLYAADSVHTAVAESLLRALPFDARGARELPAVALRGCCLSELEVAAPLRLVALHGEGLARCGQDAWLVRCEADEYPATRQWGQALMKWSTKASGLQWRPRNDDDGFAVCLYEDRAANLLRVVRTMPLDDGEGLVVVRQALRAFGVAPPQ